MTHSTTHPLTPITAAELERATALLKSAKSLTADFRFVTVGLDEPTKDELAVWPEGAVDRRVAVVGFDRPSVTLIESVVSLTTGDVLRWEPVPGAQPPSLLDEVDVIAEVMKKDPRYVEALHRRGITDLDLVHVDHWGGSYISAEDDPTRRLCRPLSYYRGRKNGQFYAHPIDGLYALFDVGKMEVIDVDDVEIIPIPEHAGEFIPELMMADETNRPRFDQLRDDVATISITEPDGPSWHVDDHHVTWQKWSVRIGWNVREGLVLHELTYDDRGVVRPVLHRAALCEMVVPYGDPSPSQFRKLAFDAGEVGLGLTPTPLSLGCDCLGEIFYFEGLANDQDGNAIVLPNAICMHEEDAGIGWKHVDLAAKKSETRRMQRLVISSIATIGNYEYGFFWYLYQDGSIELEAKLNGIMQVGALRAHETSNDFGVTVAPGLYAPNHQHFFCARLDVAVDGPNNTVTEVDSVPLPFGPDNPYGNAWVAQETTLRREGEAQRRLDADKARFWRITNPDKVTDLGTPTAYRLLPGGNAVPLHHPDAPMWPRMSFTNSHLWVTPSDRDEMYAGGKYPYQNPGPDGLPKWTQANRSIENTDIAVWYVFGMHHVPRVEDWPVMPVDRIGFALKPDGFFDGNPALDLPRIGGHGAGHCQPAADVPELPEMR